MKLENTSVLIMDEGLFSQEGGREGEAHSEKIFPFVVAALIIKGRVVYFFGLRFWCFTSIFFLLIQETQNKHQHSGPAIGNTKTLKTSLAFAYAPSSL